MLLQDLISEKFMAKRGSEMSDADREAARQRAIKDILSKHHAKKISTATANKQLQDRDHPGIVDEEVVTEGASIASGDFIKKIGKKHGVDFDDADGKAAFAAMHECYQKGWDAGHTAALIKKGNA